MKRMICLFGDQLMRFGTHHNIRRFDTDHKIIITHFFDNTNFVQCTFHKTFCRHTMIFFYKFFLQGTAVYTNTDRNVTFFCHIHDSPNTVCTSDISGINTDFICAVFHCCNCKTIIKMNICNQWNMNLFLNFF